MSAELRKLDGGHCFYCGHALNDADVDHFIPFSLYPRDLAHNFVLTHPLCNRSKSDTLAARPHLERWLERLEKRADDLSEIGITAGVVADKISTHKVALWGYSNSSFSCGHAWLSPAKYEPVNESYLSLFNTD
ncbi:HNH nuclease (fragment) [Cupriavidus taiwanensis]